MIRYIGAHFGLHLKSTEIKIQVVKGKVQFKLNLQQQKIDGMIVPSLYQELKQ